MPFPFRLLYDLLERLESSAKKSSSVNKKRGRDTLIIYAWFNKHGEAIPRRGPVAVALLSYLFPGRRLD